LYAFLKGKPPFDCGSVKQTLSKIQHSDYSVSELSSEAQNLVSLLLSKNPQSRPSPKQILEHPFLNESKAFDYSYYEYRELMCSKINSARKIKTLNLPLSSCCSPRYSVASSLDKDNYKERMDNLRRSLQHRRFSPLNIRGLQEFKHILQKGELKISKGWAKVKIGRRELKISQDGQVAYYKGKKYLYSQLTSNSAKLYQYAKRCVDVIRQKTPAQTIEEKDVVFSLMSNLPSPNLEAYFTNGDRAIYNPSQDHISLTKENQTLQIEVKSPGEHSYLVSRILKAYTVCLNNS